MFTAFSFFYPLPAYKGINYLRPVITALGTLAIGFFFFISASAFPRDPEVMKRTLQIINWSGLVIILWSAVQAFSWYTLNRYPQWMFDLQGMISSRVLYRQRVTGLALEPSWLAHQLNLLYLPFWLAASTMSFSSHKFRFLALTLENFLLAAGIITLGLTLSRVGFLAFFCMAAAVFGVLHGRLVNRIQKWTDLKNKTGVDMVSKSRPSVISAVLILVYIVILSACLVFYSRFDPRMKSLFVFNFSQENFLLRYFNELRFGDRVIYWLAGWKIFEQYPLFGVGLGNAGFLIPTNIEPYGWSLLEVRRLIYRESFLLNIKSLWFRLLGETGIIGFSFFIGVLVSLTGEYIKKFAEKKPIHQVLGFTGLLTLLALVFEGFSIDSFAMPYWWISLGLASIIIQDDPKGMESQVGKKRLEKNNGKKN